MPMPKNGVVRRTVLVAAAFVLCLSCLWGSLPVNARGEEVELYASATNADLLNDEIWLEQSVSGKCTLASTAMMLRRAAILNGSSSWEDITEQSVESAAWDSSVGLRWYFTCAGMSVAEADLSWSNEDVLIGLLEEHPEGVVIYNWAHAVLLTDYTDGVLYCADPAFGDRRPLDESSRGVNADNIQQYWYITSYVAPPEDGDGEDPHEGVGPAVEITGQWMDSGSRWWYRWSDGTYAHNETLSFNGEKYHFDGEGWLVTGWWREGGQWYYSASSGAIRTGWAQLGGTWYWLDPESGAMATGWKDVNGTWYHFASSGAMVTGWLDNGDWYWLAPSGAMVTGWQKVNGTWYFFKGSGAMATGWVDDQGTWYYMRSSGAMTTGWQKVNGTWYLMRDSGAMATGWQKVGNSWYWFNASGAMATGWQKVNGRWYWLDTSGAMASGRWVGNYYVGPDGTMLTNTVTPDGYRVLADGKWDGSARVR